MDKTKAQRSKLVCCRLHCQDQVLCLTTLFQAPSYHVFWGFVCLFLVLVFYWTVIYTQKSVHVYKWHNWHSFHKLYIIYWLHKCVTSVWSRNRTLQHLGPPHDLPKFISLQRAYCSDLPLHRWHLHISLLLVSSNVCRKAGFQGLLCTCCSHVWKPFLIPGKLWLRFLELYSMKFLLLNRSSFSSVCHFVFCTALTELSMPWSS